MGTSDIFLLNNYFKNEIHEVIAKENVLSIRQRDITAELGRN
jgi:hypothetical protein